MSPWRGVVGSPSVRLCHGGLLWLAALPLLLVSPPAHAERLWNKCDASLHCGIVMLGGILTVPLPSYSLVLEDGERHHGLLWEAPLALYPRDPNRWYAAWDIVPSRATYPGPTPLTYRLTPRLRLPCLPLGAHDFGLSPSLGVGAFASRKRVGPRVEARFFLGNVIESDQFRAIGGFVGAACEASLSPCCEQFEFSAGLEIPIPIT